jgi:putative hydrolases of HD superfamily
MDTASVVHTLLQANQLKRTTRTGWVQRGVSGAEHVAGHSYGVAFTTFVLARLLDEPVDLGRALSLAILHDLPEALTGDVPTPAWRLLPEGAKLAAERAALQQILGDLPMAGDWLALWLELEQADSVEAKLVLDADRLDLYLQALVYEQQSGNQRLAEFWQRPATFHFEPSRQIYDFLRSMRPASP